ncbi:MAG TPA: LysM peptidoglycan-binding domain-containing protein, partial [Polyangium sp.]|nr:LysM peptidoglycan-binding domain-containing protein [Polyangium sp.]
PGSPFAVDVLSRSYRGRAVGNDLAYAGALMSNDDTPFDLGPPPPIFIPPPGPVAGAPPPAPVAFAARAIVPEAPPPAAPAQPQKIMALSAKAPGSYTVKSGDTLGAIAEQYDTTVSAILKANPQISNPNQISVGQPIKLPGASSGTGGASPQPSQPKPPPKKPPPKKPAPAKDKDDDKDSKAGRKLIFPLWKKATASWKDGPRYFGCPRSGGRKHGGVDLYAPFGSKIRAIADGVIIRAPYFFYDGTNALEVFHPGVGVVRYGEISSSKRVPVRAGQKVKCGEHIAYVGLLDSLGMSMIHFELFGERARGQALTQMSGPYRRHPALKNPTPLIDKLHRLTFK